MESNAVVLISGANRGLGRGILELYLSRANHTVIAANRDPAHASSRELLALPKAKGTILHVVKLDATSDTDTRSVVQQLQREFNIVHVDIVFANAGVGYAIPKVSELKISDSKAHFETNVYGVLRLYQAFLPLLKRSPNHPKWVSMGSSSGRLHDFLEWPNAA